jgi:hypothetical protein
MTSLDSHDEFMGLKSAEGSVQAITISQAGTV